MSRDIPLRIDTGNRFQSFTMSEDEIQYALKSVPPLFLAYLQNKIATYASELVDTKLPYNAHPTAQVEAILAHERLRNFVSAYEELLSEIADASQPSQPELSTDD